MRADYCARVSHCARLIAQLLFIALVLLPGGSNEARAACPGEATGGPVTLSDGSSCTITQGASLTQGNPVVSATNGSHISGTDTAIGATSAGVVASGGGHIDLIGPTITSVAAAFRATGTGSTVTAQGVSFTTTGANGYGVLADAGGQAQVNGGTIHTATDWSFALIAGSDPSPIASQLTATNVTMVTAGQAAHAVATLSQSHATLSGGSITTNGIGANGIMAYQASTVVASGTTITTTGEAGRGVTALEGSTVELHNVTLHTTGLSADGLRSFFFNSGAGFQPTALNSILVDGGSVTADQGAGIRVAGANAAITVQNGAVVTSGINRLMDVLAENGNPGHATLTANNATLNGDIDVDAASTATVTLSNNAVLTGAVQGVQQMNVIGSRWTLTGNSTITGTLTNAGTIQFTPPSQASTSTSDVPVSLSLSPSTGTPSTPSGFQDNAVGVALATGGFKTLTTVNYVGAGGTLGLNTFLGADNSASDRLVINGGSATGISSLHITNAGGPGAETTGNGILVVEVTNGGTTEPGAFTLAGEARAGAFDYRLFRGAPNDPPADPIANDWFLRSTFVNGPGGPEEPIGPTPPPEVLPPGVFPIIGPELATYGVVQPIARQIGLTTLGSLHERVGDAAADAACLNATPDDGAAFTKAPPAPNSCRQAVWGRLFGQQIDNHYQAFADPRASGQVAGIQTGIDVWRGSLIPGHSDTAGFYFAYGNGHVSVDGLVTNPAATAYVLQHTGSVNLNAYSLGGYWTHYGPTGWYIDAVLQGSFYNGDASTQFASLPTNGTGFTSSLEAGYPIPLPWFGPRFVLEPEGQIIWQQLSFRDGNDGLGAVALGTTSGASGRLGLRGKWTINDPAGRVWQPYVLANVWRDFGADSTTLFGPDPVPLLEQATRVEFAGGLSAKIRPGLSLYAQAGYQFATSGTDGGRRDGVRGDLGVHYAW